MFRPTHPTETAGTGNPFPHEVLPDEGGHDGDESGDVRCKHCGFLVHSKDRSLEDGTGQIQHSTQVSSAVTAGDTTINVDSTAGFDSSGTFTIFDHDNTGCRDEDFVYTSKTSTTFVGSTGTAHAHAVDVNIRDDVEVVDGCPLCGSKAYM